MRPALAEQVNNELEAVYFIDRVYSKDPMLYDKCISGLKEYKDYFPQVERITSEKITSPGNWTKNQIYQKFSGHDVPARRNIFKRIKDNFKKTWFVNAGFPELPDNLGGVTKFRKNHRQTFSNKTLSFSLSSKDLIIKFAYFSLTSTTKVIWINAGGAESESEFKRAMVSSVNNGNNINPDAELSDFYIQLFNTRASVIIIENAPFLSYAENRDRLFREYNSATFSVFSQLVLLEEETNSCSGEEITKNTQLESSSRMHLKPGYVAAFILIIVISVFTYSRVTKHEYRPVLVQKYLGDEIQQDRYIEGILLTWTDKEGNFIQTDDNNYSDTHTIQTIPERAEKLMLSKGNFEHFPDKISVLCLRADTLRVVFYRTFRLADVSTDTIVGMNAQRWYTFVSEDSARVRFICEALTGSLSPKIAVFSDRFGKERIIANGNATGGMKSVKISGILPRGKY